jgi:hypothetical protein
LELCAIESPENWFEDYDIARAFFSILLKVADEG